MKRSNLALIGMVLFFLPFIGNFIVTYAVPPDKYGWYNIKFVTPTWIAISALISAGFAIYWLYLIKKE